LFNLAITVRPFSYSNAHTDEMPATNLAMPARAALRRS
jgi:hypothetical protein